jgi:hypothetical protein
MASKSVKKITLSKNKNKNRNPRGQSTSIIPKQVAPVAIARTIAASRPNLRYSTNGDCVISHREYFADMSCNAAFTVGSISIGAYPTGLVINPGNPLLFPWLSRMAANFESYSFQMLEFGYFSEVSTATAGRIILAVDYDVSDPPPNSKIQALANRASVAATAWGECALQCLPADLHKRQSYFVDTAATPSTISSRDPGLTATGVYLPCSQGGAGGVTGELYVRYTVKFMTPHISPIVYGNTFGRFLSTTGMSTANWVGTNMVAAGYGDKLNGALTFATTGLITFNIAGLFLFNYIIDGTVLSGVAANVLTGGATSPLSSITVEGTATQGTVWILVNVTALPATITPGMTAATTVTSSRFVGALIGAPQ